VISFLQRVELPADILAEVERLVGQEMKEGGVAADA